MEFAYSLSYPEDGSAIFLSLSENSCELLRKYCNRGMWLIEHFQRRFSLSRECFSRFGRNHFGYHGCLRFDSSESKVVIKLEADKALVCLTASLMILFRCLNYNEGEYAPREPMEIDLEVLSDSYDLRARCSAGLHDWLDKKYGYGSEKPLIIATEAMMRAGGIVRPPMSKLWRHFVRAGMLPMGGIDLHCDSNCCCMGPGGAVRRGHSFMLSTHNSDGPPQLLTFLAGLAAISEEYIADSKGE